MIKLLFDQDRNEYYVFVGGPEDDTVVHLYCPFNYLINFYEHRLKVLVMISRDLIDKSFNMNEFVADRVKLVRVFNPKIVCTIAEGLHIEMHDSDYWRPFREAIATQLLLELSRLHDDQTSLQ